jgi:hypothetical protein
MKRIAAIIYGLLTAVVILFQLALAGGAPWGEYAMGGAYPGQFPPALRVAAVVQALILAGFLWIIAVRGGLLFTRRPKLFAWLAWVVVAYGVIGFVLNVITPSAGERLIWAPVTLVLLICSLVVVWGKPATS